MQTNSNLITKANELFRQHRKLFVSYTVIFLIVLLMFAHDSSPKIVIFDFKTTYNAFLSEVANSKLSQEDISKLGKRFPQAVSNVVNRYAKTHNAVIVTKGVVIAGGIDGTQEIQKQIAKEMRRLSQEENKTSGT